LAREKQNELMEFESAAMHLHKSGGIQLSSLPKWSCWPVLHNIPWQQAGKLWIWNFKAFLPFLNVKQGSLEFLDLTRQGCENLVQLSSDGMADTDHYTRVLLVQLNYLCLANTIYLSFWF